MPVTPSFFRLLRAGASRQDFTEQEAEVGQNRKVILSYGLWQRLFGGRDEAVGKELRINGNQFTIVGVMPREFRFIDPEVQLWTAVAFTAQERADDSRHSVNWQQFARLKPGASIDQARARSMRSTLISSDSRSSSDSHQCGVQHQGQAVSSGSHRGLGANPDALGRSAVLVIGVVNVANLVSVRATSRVRELATDTRLVPACSACPVKCLPKPCCSRWLAVVWVSPWDGRRSMQVQRSDSIDCRAAARLGSTSCRCRSFSVWSCSWGLAVGLFR